MTTEPSGRLFQFDLTQDVLQDSTFAPFASNGSSPSVDPNKPLPEISSLAFLERDGGVEDQIHAVWLRTCFYIQLGWWVAGDVIDQSDLPTDATATYEGHAIGNVATNIGGNGWVTYVATGDMNMDWDFNARSGNLNIYHFDRGITPGGLTFTGEMTTPGVPGTSSAVRFRSPKIFPTTSTN